MAKDMLDRFKVEYLDYNSISEKRQIASLKTLRKLSVHAGVPVEEVTPDHLRSFLGGMVADLAPNTIEYYLKLMSPFFTWAFDADVIDADTFLRLRRVRSPRGAAPLLPRPYSRSEIDVLWQRLDEGWPVDPRLDHWLARYVAGKSPYRRPWRGLVRAQTNAMIHLALHAGMRKGEIFNAELDDIHYDNEFVVVSHAARKNRAAVVRPREVPMTVSLSAALEGWINLRAQLPLTHDKPWLSLSPHSPHGSNPLAPYPWESTDRHPVPRMGYEFHRLRHTCGTEWLRAGMPLEQVSKLLGHATLQQTLGYAMIVKTDLRKSMEAAAADFERAVGRRTAA